MKKLFLLLTATAFGFASMANGGWTNEKSCEEPQTIQLIYNEYGDGDNGSFTKAYSWQGGNPTIVYEAAENALNEDFDTWEIAVGQQFSFTVEGTCNATGTFKTGLVDEQKEAAYFFKVSDFATPEISVTAGEPFKASFVYTVKDLAKGKTFVVDDTDVSPENNLVSLVLGFAMKDYAAATEFNGKAPSDDKKNVRKVEFDFTTFEFKYLGDLSQYTKPYALVNAGAADKAEDGFKYQGLFDFTYNQKAEESDFFNFSLSGTATQDISTLMIALWDNSEKAEKPYATSLCEEEIGGMGSVLSDIKAGEPFSVKGSLPLKRSSNGEENTFQMVLLAQSQVEVAQIILDLATADEFGIGATKNYGDPRLDVVVISAADAIVNGVIYSEGAIVIFNQAGQKVAAASQEFAIASLGAGVYFAKTAEGSFSFVVK